jgi:hypothetical protein
MITQEHLEHWMKEIRYQLQGILNEVAENKVGKGGIMSGNGKYVSFDYLLEKALKIEGNLKMIEDDIKHDI